MIKTKIIFFKNILVKFKKSDILYFGKDSGLMLLPSRFYSDDFFDDFFKGKSSNSMKCDVYESDGNYNIEMEIPGYKKEDVKIEVDNGYITVTASKEENEESNNKNYIHKERSYGKITRTFNFGDVNPNDVKAKFEHGLLTITIPKNKEIESKKYIDIE